MIAYRSARRLIARLAMVCLRIFYPDVDHLAWFTTMACRWAKRSCSPSTM